MRYITSEKEFIVVYAGLITSAEGFKAIPRNHAIITTGKMNLTEAAIEKNGFEG